MSAHWSENKIFILLFLNPNQNKFFKICKPETYACFRTKTKFNPKEIRNNNNTRSNSRGFFKLPISSIDWEDALSIILFRDFKNLHPHLSWRLFLHQDSCFYLHVDRESEDFLICALPLKNICDLRVSINALAQHWRLKFGRSDP